MRKSHIEDFPVSDILVCISYVTIHVRTTWFWRRRVPYFNFGLSLVTHYYSLHQQSFFLMICYMRGYANGDFHPLFHIVSYPFPLRSLGIFNGFFANWVLENTEIISCVQLDPGLLASSFFSLSHTFSLASYVSRPSFLCPRSPII